MPSAEIAPDHNQPHFMERPDPQLRLQVSSEGATLGAKRRFADAGAFLPRWNGDGSLVRRSPNPANGFSSSSRQLALRSS